MYKFQLAPTFDLPGVSIQELSCKSDTSPSLDHSTFQYPLYSGSTCNGHLMAEIFLKCSLQYLISAENGHSSSCLFPID